MDYCQQVQTVILMSSSIFKCFFFLLVDQKPQGWKLGLSFVTHINLIQNTQNLWFFQKPQNPADTTYVFNLFLEPSNDFL